MDRLKEEGRQPPQGQLTESFIANEIQTDAELRSRLVDALQRRGILPPQPTSSTSANGSAPAQNGAAANNQAPPTNLNQVPPSNLNQLPPNGLNQLPSNGPNQLPPNGLNQAPQPTTTQPVIPPPPPVRPLTVQRPVPYGSLEALQGLYTQVPNDTSQLTRFGLDIFRNGTGNADLLPTDLPAGPDYVLGVGDAIVIHIWGSGSVAQDLPQTIDRTGMVNVPQAGSVMLAGQTMRHAGEILRKALNVYFKNAQVDVSLTRVRSVRVYVVGDVQRPGAYDINSLSTPLNALFTAGGPTENGSLRNVKHYRGKKLISDVDVYELILNGVRTDVARLEPGDTILVPPVGPQITVAGMVRRPGIYEMKEGGNLAEALDLAGGVLVSATLRQINLERVQAHERHMMLSLSLAEGSEQNIKPMLGSFQVQDGDRITISAILPYDNQTVYLDGHVFRPGKYPFHPGMQVSDLIKSYQDLLPEPAQRAEIVRLVPPNYRPTVLEFDLGELLSGEDPLELQPFDTVRVLGRYDLDPPKVTITGEVLRPGEYPMSEGMTAAQLVRMAGGFKSSAYRNTADVSSYVVKNGARILTEHNSVDIGKALAAETGADVPLKRGDVVTIRQLAGWRDIGAMVTLDGEVMYPGTYGIGEGEKLSSLIKRAGGFRTVAFPEGAVLERAQVRELAEASQEELIQRIETQGAGFSFGSAMNAQEQQVMMQSIMQQQKQVVSALRKNPPTGRMVINVTADLGKWENTPADIELEPGDVLRIPRRPKFVMIAGQVYSPSATTYVPGKTAEFYLRAAGGFTKLSNEKDTFIVRANGSVISKGKGFWGGGIMSARMEPGDTIVVPEKIIGGSDSWRNLLSIAQITSGLAIAARVATSF